MRIEIDDIESAPRQYKAATSGLLALLNEHHNFDLVPPEGWVKAPPCSELYEALWLAEDVEAKIPQIAEIQKATAIYFGLSKLELISRRRTLKLTLPRQIAMYLAKTLTPRPYPEIGRWFNGRDHSTVIHSVQKMERLIRENWLVAYDVAQVEAML